MTPRGVIDGSSASPQRFLSNKWPDGSLKFETFTSNKAAEECLHYDADPVWRLNPGYNSHNLTGTRQVCGTCNEPLAPALTQRQREDAALEERVRRQVAQEILSWDPSTDHVGISVSEFKSLNPLTAINRVKNICARVACWPGYMEEA